MKKHIKRLVSILMALVMLIGSEQLMTFTFASASPPGVPQNVKAVSASYNSVKISWSAVSGATGYVVYRSDTATKDYERLTVTKSTSYTNTGIVTGKTYYYKSRAYKNVNGKNSYGNPSGEVHAKPIPATPGSFKIASVTQSSIKTSWSAVTGAGGYEIYRSVLSTIGFYSIGTVVSTSFDNKSLQNNKSYYYKVRAYTTIKSTKVYGNFTAAIKGTTAATAGTVAIPKDKIKIGVLLITSIQDTSGYTFSHHSGLMEMKHNLGLSDIQVIEKDNVPDTDITATRIAIQQLIDSGCNIIFATSYNYMNTMEAFANDPKYQGIIFSHCSGYKSNAVNFNNYFGRIYEAFYLSGIAAGMKAKQRNNPNLGFVAPMDVANSEVSGGIDAWALGIQSVYPAAKVKVKVTGSWYDPQAEKEAAQALVDAGCCVLGQYCDSDTTQTTAEKNHVFGCGYNYDMTVFAPKAHLCAPVWNWGVYYTQVVQQVIDGKWTPTNYYEGMNKGLVDVSPINETVAAPGTKAAVDAAKAKIVNGELFVFTGPIIDNKGRQIIGAGKMLTDAQITGGINYYIKGVELL